MQTQIGQPTFRSIVTRSFQVWGRKFVPLTVVGVLLLYVGQMVDSALRAQAPNPDVHPLVDWTLAFIASEGTRILSGAVASIVAIRIVLEALGYRVTEPGGHRKALERHVHIVALIYLILSPGEILANLLLPPVGYIVASTIYSLCIALWFCADVARVAEGGSLRQSFRRSHQLLRGRIWLVLGLMLLWEAASWGAHLATNPGFLDGLPSSDPASKWLVQPIAFSAAWLLFTIGSTVLFADLRRARQNAAAQVFD